MSSQNVISHASFVGPSTSVSSATRQSCKSVWRSLHQSTNSHKLWTSRLQSNSSSFWRNIAQSRSCRRARAWRQRPKPRSLERTKLHQRSSLTWEPDATQSPRWWNRRKLNSLSSPTMSTQLRWVFDDFRRRKIVMLMKRISSTEGLCGKSSRFIGTVYALLETWPSD